MVGKKSDNKTLIQVTYFTIQKPQQNYLWTHDKYEKIASFEQHLTSARGHYLVCLTLPILNNCELVRN